MENINKFALSIDTTRLKNNQKPKKKKINKQPNKRKTVGSISYQKFRKTSPWIRFYLM